MSDNLSEFQVRAGDWRATIKSNQRHTVFVIASFIVIYVIVGLVIDLSLYTNQYPHATLSQIFWGLITFQITPIATIIACIVAVISILVAIAFHDKLMLLGSEYREITGETAQNLTEKQLFNVVEEMMVAAGLQFMPKVYLIEAQYMNAFASGYSEKSAMVAITRGLIEKLDRDELTAVMAHELSHIRHLDIKLTLMASVLSNITLILIDVLFWNVMFGGGNSNREDDKKNNQLFIIIMVLRYVLPLLTVILMMYLSRVREYMADAGCVELMRNNEPLARALLKIQNDHEDNKAQYAAAYSATPHESIRRQAYIFDPIVAGIEAHRSISDMFSTHPSVEQRLKAMGISKSKT